VQVVTERLQKAGQQMPPKDLLRQQVLERLVLQEIQMQRAERAGIKVSDEQLNQTLTEVAARNNVKFSDLPAVLESQGIEYRTYREEVRREMIIGQLRSRDVYRRTAYYVSDPKRPSREWERGPDVLAARLPLLLSDTPCFTGPYRRIGEDNDHVYRDLLGMSPEEMSTLIDRGVLQ